MTDVAEVLTQAQEAAIRGSSAVIAAATWTEPRVYRVIPTNAALPYIKLGEDQVIDDSDECQEGSEIFSTVHVWSRPETPQALEARRIAAALRLTLNADLAIAGHDLVLHAFETALFTTDPSGDTHAILTFRYLTTPSEA